MSASTPATADGRLVSVDVLRGAAALAVVATHTPRTPPTGFDLSMLAALPLDLGVLGVPMFIVLSGFCIHLGFARRLATGRTAGWSWAAFWKRRFVRLYPTYLAAVAVSLAVAYWVPAPTGSPRARPAGTRWDIGTHLLMVHNLTAEFIYGCGNQAFWTLGLEEQLYGLFAVVVLLRARLSPWRVLAVGAAVSAVWQVGRVWVPFLLSRYAGGETEPVIPLGPVSLGAWHGWPFGWWFLWLLGAVAAEAHVGLVRVPAWLTSRRLMLVAGAVTVLTHELTLGRYARYWLPYDGPRGWLKAGLNTAVGFSDLVFGVACFALLSRLIRTERAGRLTAAPERLLARLGLISYSLYLVHVPVLAVLGPVLGKPSDVAGVLFALGVGVAASIAFAVPFFMACERPFLRRPAPVQ